MSYTIYSLNAICEKYNSVGEADGMNDVSFFWQRIWQGWKMICRESIAATKDCNENWYENNWLHSHYTPWIVIFSSPLEAAPILHWLMSLPDSSTSVCFKNIFDINGPLGKASNKILKIDAGALILVTGQEEIFYLLLWKDISWYFNKKHCFHQKLSLYSRQVKPNGCGVYSIRLRLD